MKKNNSENDNDHHIEIIENRKAYNSFFLLLQRNKRQNECRFHLERRDLGTPTLNVNSFHLFFFVKSEKRNGNHCLMWIHHHQLPITHIQIIRKL